MTGPRPAPKPARTLVVKVRMTEAEYQRLQQLAQQRDESMSQVVRKALRQTAA